MEVLKNGGTQPLTASEPFLAWLAGWESGLAAQPLAEIVREAGGAGGVAIHAVDVTVGFCASGPLSSPRVGALVPPIVALFRRAHDLGVRHFVLPQDAHPESSPEFRYYPPHAVAGSPEAETMPELRALPFSDQFVVVPKRSVNVATGTELEAWLAAHPEVTHHIVVGDCTDICVYQLAMHLKTRAIALGMQWEVVVPEECVQTYDLPVAAAEAAGALPHDGDLLHLVFLYHMALNGVRVVGKME